MTGADVLVVVSNDTERRFFATGELREMYLSTIGKDSDQETKTSDLVGKGDTETPASVIEPLGDTPSPRSTAVMEPNRLRQVIGVPKPRRSLNLENIEANVRDVLCTRPVPVLLPSEQTQTPAEEPSTDHLDSQNSQAGFQPTPSPK